MHSSGDNTGRIIDQKLSRHSKSHINLPFRQLANMTRHVDCVDLESKRVSLSKNTNKLEVKDYITYSYFEVLRTPIKLPSLTDIHLLKIVQDKPPTKN